MKLSLLLLVLSATIASASTVRIRLSADSLTGTSGFFGQQQWFAENNSFYSDVAANGFDFVVSYDTEALPFNVSGALGTQYRATIESGFIGLRDSSTIANLSGIVAIFNRTATTTVPASTTIMFTAREQPYGEFTIGYNWNDVNFTMTDQDQAIPRTSLPDQETLLAEYDIIDASVRNARGGNVLASRETRGGPGDGISAAPVPEPSIAAMLLGTLAFLSRRRRK